MPISDTPPFFFRLIEKKDNPTVASIIRDVMTEFGTVGPGYSINDPEVDFMYEAYSGEGSIFWVLEHDDEVVGCGGIGPLTGGLADTCELKKMYFRPVARGRGLGRKLVEMALEKASEFGYKRCYLETVIRMEAANRLYVKMGFRPLEAQLGATGHNSCESYYVKDLG